MCYKTYGNCKRDDGLCGGGARVVDGPANARRDIPPRGWGEGGALWWISGFSESRDDAGGLEPQPNFGISGWSEAARGIGLN